MADTISATSSKGKEKVDDSGNAEINKLVAIGSKAFGLKKYDEATENFAKACEEYVKENGKDDPDLLFLYGRALFQIAITSSDVLGGTKPPAAIEQEKDIIGKKALKASSPEPEPSVSKNGLFQFTGDAEDESEEEDEEEEEAENDFETAWDVLDLARTIYENEITKLTADDEGTKAKVIQNKKKIADIYDILGEISLESGKSHEELIANFFDKLICTLNRELSPSITRLTIIT